MKVRDGFFEKHYDVADGTRYRVEASRKRGWWTGEIYREPSSGVGSGGEFLVGLRIDDDDLGDPGNGHEVCDLTWKRFGLEA